MTKQPSWLVGSAPECDVVIAQPTISGQHCRLSVKADGYILEDLGSTNGTYVNGERIRGSVQVQRSDTITLGTAVPLCWPEGLESSSRAGTSAGDGSGRVLQFQGGPLVVGRDAGCDRVIDLPMISGRHARLSRPAGTILIEDLGSSNGTFVNGRRVDRPTPVKPGDQIGLGSHELTLADAAGAGASGSRGDEERQGFAAKARNGARSSSPDGAKKTLRIFVSSPGDVAEERVIADRVISRVSDRYASILSLEPIIWEHEPIQATGSFQEQITRPSETDIFVSILWARLGTRLPASIRRPDGTRYHSGTEYEFEDAIEAHRRHGAPDVIAYLKAADPPPLSLSDTAAADDTLRQKKLLDAFVQRWFHGADGSLVAAFHSFREASEFEERFEQHLLKLVANKAKQLGWSLDKAAQAARVTWTKGSPYRGLEAFDVEHEPIFFGRTRAISAALQAMRDQAAAGHPFLLVLASSGSGKSSLVRAGLLPMLTRPGVVSEVADWRRAVMRPSDAGGDLFLGLATALLLPGALPELARTYQGAALAALLRDQPEQSLEAISRVLLPAPAEEQGEGKAKHPNRGGKGRLALVIDQMEELFSLERIAAAERSAFCGLVDRLCRGGVWVIATLRSDFYHRFAEVPVLTHLKAGRGQLDLQPPTASEIDAIIRQPAIAAGLLFEFSPRTQDRLEALLCDAAAKNPESLPLLEFTLDELYKRRSDRNALTLKAYHELGGLEGALATRAQEVFEELPAEVQAQLPRVFRQLVTVGEGEGAVATRKPALLPELTADPRAARLVEAFVQARLVVTKQGVAGTPTAEISHEALLTRWEPLRQWVASDRELLRVRGRVAAVARLWAENKRSADRLLADGQPLNEARRLKRAGFDLTPVEDELIDVSLGRAHRNRQAKRAGVVTLASISAVALVALASALIEGFYGGKRLIRAERSFKLARQIVVDESLSVLRWEELRDNPGLQKLSASVAIKANKSYEALAKIYPSDKDVILGLGRVEAIGGALVGSIGSLDESIALFEHATGLLGRLSREHPQDSEARKHWALAEREFGVALRQAGERAVAPPHLEIAYRELRKLHFATPSHQAVEFKQEVEFELAQACLNLGFVTKGSAEQKARYEEAAQHFEASRTSHPRPSDCRAGLARSLVYRSRLEEGDEARELCDEALAHCSEALKDAPQSPAYAAIKSEIHYCRGISLWQLGRTKEAIKDFDESIKIGARIVEQNPKVDRFRWSLAESLNQAANFFSGKQVDDTARDYYTRACTVLEPLKSDDRPIHAETLLSSRIGLARFEGSRTDPATQNVQDRRLDSAIEKGKELCKRFRGAFGLSYHLSRALNLRAQSEAERKQDAAALPFHIECLQTLAEAARASKETPLDGQPSDEQLAKMRGWAANAAECAQRLQRDDKVKEITTLRARITKESRH